MMMTAGCESTKPDIARKRSPLLIIRYEWPLNPANRVSEINEDLRRIRGLGIETVWLDHVAATDTEQAVQAARSAELHPFVSDRTINQYIQYKRLPAGSAESAEFIISRLISMNRLSSSIALPPFSGPSTSDRLRQWFQLCSQRHENSFMTLEIHNSLSNICPTYDRPYAHITISLNPTLQPSGITARLPIWEQRPSEQMPATTSNLIQYYQALAAGCTDGLLFWRYRSWPDQSNGIVEFDGSLNPNQAASIRSILQKVSGISDRLIGAEPLADSPARMDSTKLKHQVFLRGEHAVILVYNEDPAHFSRGTLHIKPNFMGKQVLRAVTVSSGERHLPQHDEISILLNLRPEDAELFELH